MSDEENREHFIGFTLAELTVIACALHAHQQKVDGIVGFRGATRFHSSAMEKIKAYCDSISNPRRA